MKVFSSAIIASFLMASSQFSFGQEGTVGASSAGPASGNSTSTGTDPVDMAVEDEDSTVVYPAEFFASYNPVTANDMLDRIPGLSIDNNGGGGGGDRGLGTGGNLLIDGQRIAGKDNSPRDQLNRIAAREVQRIEIIRNTSGELAVRGASQVVNIVLIPSASRSSTSVELVNRLNHDDTFETGGSIAHSRQIGNFQALINFEARPNYENRETREARIGPSGEQLGTLFETEIRDQDEYTVSSNMSYNTGAHRVQFNTQFRDSDHPNPVFRDFIDHTASDAGLSFEEEQVDRVENDWEIGGDYEYRFDSGARASLLFVVNEEVRDYVRERFRADPADSPAEKNLFIESNSTTSEKIVQGNYNFSLTAAQSLRVGMERADTQLDSSLLIGSNSGSLPPSPDYGGLSPEPSISNPGTSVQEIRYEGFAFHNWTLNDRMALESSLVYETSEISQTGLVSKTRDFQFWRPAVDYRFNITDNFQFRASAERTISQLSFSNFAATADDDDRDVNADAGNPELVPEKRWRYEAEVEYRLPDDAGVLNTRVFYDVVNDYIGNINATVDPDNPISATGNVGTANRWGMFINTSTRLGYFDMPDAIISADLALFDSEITDPFLGNTQRTGGRGFGSLSFRHDVTGLGLSYGLEYRHPIHGGNLDIDINTITRNDGRQSWDMFVSKVFFDDVTFRLDSDNTFGDSRCRERLRFDGTTIDGTLQRLEDSCSSRYQRLTLSVQTTF